MGSLSRYIAEENGIIHAKLAKTTEGIARSKVSVLVGDDHVHLAPKDSLNARAKGRSLPSALHA